MPMKNAGPYVRDAVASVLAQEYESLEIVVVDDGSSDGSREIVEGMREPRVRIVPGPKRGVSAAWNVALARASGDVVMQCDADDLFPPHRIGSQMALLDARPELGAVCGRFATIDRSGRVIAELGVDATEAEDITGELLQGRTRTHLCTFAARRVHLEAIGGKREYFDSGEDIDLQMRLAEVCRVWYEPVSRYLYRIHDASLTHRQASNRRVFFEEYARKMRAQRAGGQPDDLQCDRPLAPPAHESPPERTAQQAQGMLLGDAWRKHARGEKLSALAAGARALRLAPFDGGVWRSLAALLVKPAGPKGPR